MSAAADDRLLLTSLVPGLSAANETSAAVKLPDSAYLGASLRDRSVSAWRAFRQSADAEILPEQDQLVSRARELDRNSGIARGGIQTIIDNVVGAGLRLNPRPNYQLLGKSKEWADEWSRNVRSHWLTWAETTACDAADTLIFDQITAQVLRTQFVSGDAVNYPAWIPNSRDGWSTKIQAIDPDRLSTPSDRPTEPNIRKGIEIDEYGAPVAYYIRSTHPNDFNGLSSTSLPRWKRIPKYTDWGRRQLIHCYDKERSDQSRGKPLLSAVLSNFKGLDRYMAAEIQAAVVNAMVAMIIETPLDQASIEGLFQNDATAYLKARDDHAVTLESGTMATLFPGDKLNSFAPTRPAAAFGAFQENVGRIIAVGADLPYELLFKDFTKANYSSMRAAFLEAWRAFNRRRDDLGTQWGDPMFALWLEEAVNRGLVEAPDFYENQAAYTRCRWIGPGRGQVDPMKEAQASGERIKNRTSTHEDECAEQGKDWEEVFEQLAKEEQTKKRLGLMADAIATTPTNETAALQDLEARVEELEQQ